jgi:hypothetical protein
MQYVSGEGVSPNYFGPGKGGFQDGDPTTGVGGTLAQSAFFNDLLGNVMHVLDAAGVAPTPGSLDDLKNAIGNIAILFHGQCQLRYVSNIALVLAPYGGAYVRIAGKTYALPAAGLAIANTNVMVSGVAAQNLVASTAYLVFLADDGAGHAVPDFWPVATGHMTDTTAGNIGVEVRLNGAAPDPTRTLIGLVATDAGAHFSDFMTLSWFNRRQKVQRTNFSTSRSTTSGTVIEINSEIRNSFLAWAGEATDFRLNGEVQENGASIGTGVIVGVAFDGIVLEPSAAITPVPGTSIGISDLKTGLAEGLHYATVVGGATSGQTLTLYGAPFTLGAGTTTVPAELGIIVRG